jgi:4-hydroxy-4-methyl-2-oxoglutarate aldolase
MVCIIPRAAEAEVVRKALEKAREESVLERALREGMSATEAFARYGIM